MLNCGLGLDINATFSKKTFTFGWKRAIIKGGVLLYIKKLKKSKKYWKSGGFRLYNIIGINEIGTISLCASARIHSNV